MESLGSHRLDVEPVCTQGRVFFGRYLTAAIMRCFGLAKSKLFNLEIFTCRLKWLLSCCVWPCCSFCSDDVSLLRRVQNTQMRVVAFFSPWIFSFDAPRLSAGRGGGESKVHFSGWQFYSVC